ncbi:MAG: DEAD/DEAH box helicase [Pseudomonadota bacterium]
MTIEFEIAEPLAEALIDKGYDALTPVQEAVIDPDLAEKDLLVSAHTGSGKTVAFGLAMAPSLMKDNRRLLDSDTPISLVIAPTRELALQVAKELRWLYAPAGGRIATCIGGVDIRDERRALSKSVHIVVGTPGRLRDHIRRGSLEMQTLQAIVLDEADEMLNMGFREELEYILDAAPEDRRTLMFSATVPKPIARLAENYQKSAVRLNTVSLKETHVDIEYRAFRVAPSDIEKAVINLLLYYDAPNAIVFCARRDGVNKLAARLTNRGFSVVALSGEFSQKERSNSVLAMRDGRARVCVATDVAARGLDLPGLDLVIHADLPQNREALLHRSGRTGRAGRKGVSALIVPVRAQRRMERLLKEASTEANWGVPPSGSDIEEVLDERLLTNTVFQTPTSDSEQDLATALLEAFPPEQLAAAIVRLTRAKDSAPEVLQAPDTPPERGKRSSKGSSYNPDKAAPNRERRDRGRHSESDFENGQWIQLGVGRKNNADPKWLIPMLCKTGGFSRNSIGNIQIGPDKTYIELSPDAANQVMTAAGEKQVIDKSIWVGLADGPVDRSLLGPLGERKNRKKPDHKKSSAKASGTKPKKTRTGPKKSRGPNGEKKRRRKRS